MKRNYLAFLTAAVMLFGMLPQMSYAAEKEKSPVNPLKAEDLVFSGDQSGKFIYCNNPERITREALCDMSNPDPMYLMNNDKLEPGKYSMFVSQVNRTETEKGEMGFDIELDCRFYAREDTTIKLTALGLEIPTTRTQYQEGKLVKYADSIQCLNAFADYLQRPIYQKDSDKKYMPHPFEEKEIVIKKGQTAWLSEYIDRYSVVTFMHCVLLLADFEILSGQVDMNIAAIKSNGVVGSRVQVSPYAKPAPYIYDRQYKGIANNLPVVTADLSYTVGGEVPAGTALPVKLHNQYTPKEGLEKESWLTNINPQADRFVREIGAESDMLLMEYSDPKKKEYYGKAARAVRDAIWKFDVFHSDTYDYHDEKFMKENTFIPNYELDPEIDNTENACNLGNYGVTTRYHFNIKNESTKTRYLYYHLTGSGRITSIVRDADLQPATDYYISKDETETKTDEIMACVPLEPGDNEFSVDMIIPTNCAGGIGNSFTIEDKPFDHQFVDSGPVHPVESELRYNGKEFYRWDHGDILTSVDKETWVTHKLDAKTQEAFDGLWSGLSFLATDNGYMAKWDAFDGAGWAFQFYDSFDTIYFLDKNFHLIGSHSFGRYVSDMSYAGGRYYAVAGDKTFYSESGSYWPDYEGKGSMPVDNGGIFAAMIEKGDVYLSFDGKDYNKADFLGEKPLFLAVTDGVYYYYNGRMVSWSYDGLYWTTFRTKEKVESLYRSGDELVINNSERYQLPKEEKPLYLQIDKTIPAFDEPPVIEEGRMLVPMRRIFEILGAKVEWDEKTSTATAVKGKDKIEFQINNNKVMVNGVELEIEVPARIIGERTMVPIRFFAEQLGYDVDWKEKLGIAVIVPKDPEHLGSGISSSPSPSPSGSPAPGSSASPAPGAAGFESSASPSASATPAPTVTPTPEPTH